MEGYLRRGLSLPILLALFTTFLITNIVAASDEGEQGDDVRLVVFTVASAETDGYKRFMRSMDTYNLKVEVLGMNQEWRGGDVVRYPGGGYKLNLLKVGLEKYKDEEDTIIMFSDSYDVIFTTGQEEIIKKFKAFNASIVFSAENLLWPDQSVRSEYPVIATGYPYLCSGLYIGYAPYVYKAVTYTDIEDEEDDQLHFTKLYLDKKKREEWPIKLDHLATLFQNLNGARDDVKLRFEGRNSLLHNIKFNTVPICIHGNGPSKLHLNQLGNYLVNMWSQDNGCLGCEEDRIRITDLPVHQLPNVMLAIFIIVPTPFIDEFFQKIRALQYPKNKIDLFINNQKMFHYDVAKNFTEQAKKEYRSVQSYIPADGFSEGEARMKAVEHFLELDCQYYFNVDADVQIVQPYTLKLLIEQNRPILAPLVSRHGKLWTNFWGDLTPDGFYARSEDYLEIVKYKRLGVWNGAHISYIYLIKGDTLREHPPNFVIEGLDPDMAMCRTYREKGVFMYVDNRHDYGHLITTDYYETSHLHSDLWEIYNNRPDWEAKYIHQDYFRQLQDNHEVTQPCPDVYQFPIVTETYAKDLIEEMENYGQWSNGQSEDARLEGGYENVPTRDIHMKQINYEKHWLYFLKEFVAPVAEKVYPGYYSKAYALMNFVVRYRPDEQPTLRPHHDSSTYTINMALNHHNVDYKGGGAHFIRYNCSCIGLPVGYTLMHPGRLTHYHEGLETTWGTRYIMVSFIDP
ncbi:procollagen-lysine,2-oxoglutarate 5-dioxygenase 1-like [Amphiura filiformis]|uniref:procollagen-lysine,2-oxoglutarate 5-dioxygenase 1-like n=1 Tax=Amphiura filiformis TaxID=82378 RepID=UPI003B221DD7